MSQDLCSPLQCNVCLMLHVHDADYQRDTKSSSNTATVPRTCTGCNLIRYCGTPHQKLDWPQHKKFCKSTLKIKKDLNIKHPFLAWGILPKSRGDAEDTAAQLKTLIKSNLGRRLQYHEEELTSYLVYCPICFNFENVTSICPDCKNQGYCSDQHLKEHKAEHRSVCGLLDLYYSPFKTVPTNIDLELTLKQRIHNLDKTDLVEAFEKAFQTNLPKNPTHSLKDYQLFSYAADFSCICSICFSLCHMDMSQFEDCSFVIFIIGATIESVQWFRDVHCKFFFQQYPQIQQLDLHFIGPEVTEPTKEILEFNFLNTKRTVRYHCYRGLFQTVCKHFKVKPSIIIAFNCGFSQLSCVAFFANDMESLEPIASSMDCSGDTWCQGLIEILQILDTPIVFTSFTKQEAEHDFLALRFAVMRQRLKVRIDRIFEVPQNPFHDLRPLRRWYGLDEEVIYFRNNYIQAVRTKLVT